MTLPNEANKVPESFDNVPPYDSRSGDHYWIIGAGFHDEFPGEAIVLGGENLIFVSPTGCYYCGKPWSELTATRRCLGRLGFTVVDRRGEN